MTPLKDCSRAERQTALHQAASLLQSVWPQRLVHGQVTLGPNTCPTICSREPTGALRVVNRFTGELIAQSLPAPLEVLDPEVFDTERNPDEEPAFQAVASWAGAGYVLGELARQLDCRQFRAMSAPELAYVFRVWSERLGDGA